MTQSSINTKKLTGWLLIGFVLGLSVYDVFVSTNQIKGDTISEVVKGLGFHWVVLPAILGALSGHFFWSHARPTKNWAVNFFGIFVLILAIDLLQNFAHLGWQFWVQVDHHPFLVFLAGTPLGHYFWPNGVEEK